MYSIFPKQIQYNKEVVEFLPSYFFWSNFDHFIFFGWQISTAIKKTPEKNALKAKLM